jgi:DNA-binding CsgD family transcriptional regulator
MARKPTGGPVGRPEKEIDWNMYEQLCGIHCTTQEIASFLKVHEDTLRPRAVQHYGGDDYSAIYKKFQESGKCSLRRNQFAMSKTNASMAIWLGKQYLGQKDRDEQLQISPETFAHYKAFMDQLEKAQASALNKAETSNKIESIS